MNFISTDNAPKAIGPYSQAIEIDKFIYTSGQIALTPNGEMLEDDIEIQTKQVLTNLENILKEANSSLYLVIKTTIFLTNMNDFAKVNEIYATFFEDQR